MTRPERSRRRWATKLGPDFVPRALCVAGALFLTFLYGFSTAHLRWPPAAFLVEAFEQAHSFAFGPPGLTPHVRPARHELSGAAHYDADGTRITAPVDAEPRLTLLTSAWLDRDGQQALRLIDGDGKVLHEWIVAMDTIWPTQPHQDAIAPTLSPTKSYVHGSYLFDNGDVLFNLEFMGLVRLNAAGQVIWRLDRRTHHSVSRADDGSFWVCESVWRSKLEDVYPKFLGLAPPIWEDRVLRVSEAGVILQEISIYEVLFRSHLKDQFWRRSRTGPDLAHLNDVEPLPAAIAAEYPLFAAGDLLVSLRDLDLVLILDPQDGAIKWWADRPFSRQHDPDFIGGGWISVYDNRPDDSPAGQILGGTRLLELRPHTGEVRVIYSPGEGKGAPGERAFYSDAGGKAQRLDNGHWLLSESMAGRVFEIDASGRTVWEWVQERQPDGVMVAEVMEGTRYAMSLEQVLAWGPK